MPQTRTRQTAGKSPRDSGVRFCPLAPQSLIGKVDFSDAIIGQLGNLLLVSDDLNSRLKDKPFKNKKEILLKSDFKLPDEITAASTWGPTEIRQRTLMLAERAYNDAWKL
jgi:hypothetical protein